MGNRKSRLHNYSREQVVLRLITLGNNDLTVSKSKLICIHVGFHTFSYAINRGFIAVRWESRFPSST